MKVSITFDDFRLRSNSNINQTLVFTEKTIFYTFLGFTQSHSGPLNGHIGFIQMIHGNCKSENPITLQELKKFIKNVIVLMLA